MAEIYSRQIEFENVPNFRDIGGYRTRDGHTVAWRRLFRSGEMRSVTLGDLARLREELGLATVIDLRSEFEVKHRGVGLLDGAGFKYFNVSFIPDGGDKEGDARRFKEFSNMGEFYVDLVRQKEFGGRIVKALEIIAEPGNHPLVFHCAAGKDRTGIMAAVLLSVLDVADEDIKNDYCLSGLYIEALIKQLKSESKIVDDSKKLPDFFWETVPESMALLLATLRQEYGSTKDYLVAQGAEPSLISRLKTALLS
jgi:protein-tyrosine phosphatase